MVSRTNSCSYTCLDIYIMHGYISVGDDDDIYASKRLEITAVEFLCTTLY